MAAEVLGNPLVAQLGGDGVLDVVQGRLKDGLLAVQVLVAVILGEGDGDVEGLAGIVADDLLLKVVDVGAAAQGQVGAVALGVAPVKGNAVDAAYIVNVDGVTVRCRAVRDLHRWSENLDSTLEVDVVVDILFADLAQVGTRS